MPSRRNVLIGLGGLVAGGGALVSTGAFTTVEAQRTVNVETATDENALLGLSAVDDTYADTDEDGLIEINLDGTVGSAEGINQNGISTFDNLVEISNNGEDDITSIEFEFEVANITEDQQEHVDAVAIRIDGETYGDGSASTGDITDDAEMSGGDTDILEVGEAFEFGLEVNLLDHGISNIAEDAEFTLTIIANTD